MPQQGRPSDAIVDQEVRMTTTASAPTAPRQDQRTSTRVQVQKFGTFLSNMVMPVIAAFIAWGFITALFIEVGWINNIAKWIGGDTAGDWTWLQRIGGFGEFAGGGIVGPMIIYLLPLLIGYTGGKNVYDTRGGVVGAIATMGVIAGTDIPMFMGAMIMGPLGGWTMMKLDAIWTHRIRPGFEMLVNNFSAGIWGGTLATFGFFVISPLVTAIADAFGRVVDWLVGNNLLPLTAIVIEPAKVLFLNNALNHGVLTPLGAQDVAETGKSILFLLEANPAVGLGILLAYARFGKGMAKASAPGAILIHFFGGIHEIYFPYILMKPKLIVAAIAGGMTQILVNVIFGSGLVAPAAPGSIIAVYLQTPADSFVGVTLSWILGAAVTFAVASVLLKTDRSDDDGDLAGATADMESLKGRKSSVAGSLVGAGAAGAGAGAVDGPITSIVFACDAGMGSSAMGASVLRRKIQGAGFDQVTVVNKAISNLTDDVDLVVSHRDLTDRARQRSGSALHVSVDDFMNSPRYDEIVELVRESYSSDGDGVIDLVDDGPAGGGRAVAGAAAASGGVAVAEAQRTGTDVLARSSIVLGGSARTRDDAITEAGRLLVEAGAVDPSYVDAMHERERSVSTMMGNGLAIPHGTNEAKPSINRTALSYVHYPNGIDWNGKPAEFVIGIAGKGDDHLALLSNIAKVFSDAAQVERLRSAATADQVLDVLSSVG